MGRGFPEDQPGRHINYDPQRSGGPGVTRDLRFGKITTWNDPAIAADNPGVNLPATAIAPVHRGDKSGTTQNFTDYLSGAAKADWPSPVADTWPIQGGEAAQGTSGVIGAVKGGQGTIGYADESQAKGLSIAKVKVGDALSRPAPTAPRRCSKPRSG